MSSQKPNLIVEKTIEFALAIIEYAEQLESKRKFTVAVQLLKSGTSIGANVHEAQNAESRADFIHKMKIASKEANETLYWLMLCQKAPTYPDCDALKDKALEIAKILTKIIVSSKK